MSAGTRTSLTTHKFKGVGYSMRKELPLPLAAHEFVSECPNGEWLDLNIVEEGEACVRHDRVTRRVSHIIDQ